MPNSIYLRASPLNFICTSVFLHYSSGRIYIYTLLHCFNQATTSCYVSFLLFLLQICPCKQDLSTFFSRTVDLDPLFCAGVVFVNTLQLANPCLHPSLECSYSPN